MSGGVHLSVRFGADAGRRRGAVLRIFESDGASPNRKPRRDNAALIVYGVLKAGWLRRDLIDRVRDASGLPVEHVIADPDTEGLPFHVTLAVAMALPIALASRYRWLIRPVLAGYAATTIVGWLIMGPRFELAYIAKGIELALIALVLVEMFRYDGGPVAVARRFFGEVAHVARVVSRSATG